MTDDEKQIQIETALDRLAALRKASLPDHQFIMRDNMYRAHERRFKLSSEPDPRAAEIALFRSTYQDQQRRIKECELELDRLGYEPEIRHPGPTGQKTRIDYLREEQEKRGIV